jgi:hypothetical protein
MPLHDHVVAALQGSGRLSAVSKAAYVARLKTFQTCSNGSPAMASSGCCCSLSKKKPTTTSALAVG